MKTSDIKGIIPPVITPMNNDPEQTVNHQALREQVERLLEEYAPLLTDAQTADGAISL